MFLMNDCLISGVATTLSYVSRLFLDILKNVSFNNYMILNKYTLQLFVFLYIKVQRIYTSEHYYFK